MNCTSNNTVWSTALANWPECNSRLEKPNVTFRKEMTANAPITLAHHWKVFTCNSSMIGEPVRRGRLQGWCDIHRRYRLFFHHDLKQSTLPVRTEPPGLKPVSEKDTGGMWHHHAYRGHPHHMHSYRKTTSTMSRSKESRLQHWRMDPQSWKAVVWMQLLPYERLTTY